MARRAGEHDGARARARAAAALSIVSNSTLIVLKVAAGAVTGSVAIITEAIHSRSTCSRRSSRTSRSARPRARRRVAPLRPREVRERRGGVEGMLILVGAGVIVYARSTHLVEGPEVESLGFGIAVVALRARWSTWSSRPASTAARPRPTRPRSTATPRTCAPTRSPRSACSSASRSSRSPARLDRPGRRARRSPLRSSSPACGSSPARGACWSTRRCPRTSCRDPRRDRVLRRPWRGRLPRAPHPPRRRAPLRRPARPVPLRHVARGRARDRARASRTRSATRLRGADVLIHLEPEDNVRPASSRGSQRVGASAEARRSRRRHMSRRRAPATHASCRAARGSTAG